MPVELGGLYQAHDRRGALSCAQRASEEPVAPAEGHWPDSIFDMIVVDRQFAVVKIADQRRPTPQAIVDGLRSGGSIRDQSSLASEPLPERFGDRLGTLLAQYSPALGIQLPLSRFALNFVQPGVVP